MTMADMITQYREDAEKILLRLTMLKAEKAAALIAHDTHKARALEKRIKVLDDEYIGLMAVVFELERKQRE